MTIAMGVGIALVVGFALLVGWTFGALWAYRKTASCQSCGKDLFCDVCGSKTVIE